MVLVFEKLAVVVSNYATKLIEDNLKKLTFMFFLLQMITNVEMAETTAMTTQHVQIHLDRLPVNVNQAILEMD